MPIADYNPDPGENLSISGIDIAEGCPPRNINNAIRQVMADLAASPAKDPRLLASADERNALATGTDGRLYIPSGPAVMGSAAALVSGDEGNLLTVGADGLLFVDPDIGDSVPWDAVTDKPETYAPDKHAATHLPGGSDPITQPNIPSGLVGMWSGSAASIPSGWALCNGQNGTPDLRDRFVLGAGGTYAPGSTGGSATASVSGSTAQANSLNHAPDHTHTVDAAFEVSATNPGGNAKLCVHIGYAQQSGTGITGIGTTSSGSGTMQHTHTYSASIPTLPPFYALCFIMKL